MLYQLDSGYHGTQPPSLLSSDVGTIIHFTFWVVVFLSVYRRSRKWGRDHDGVQRVYDAITHRQVCLHHFVFPSNHQ